MYKSILVPLDGSARAERILPHVEEMALNFGAEMILLRVIQPVHPMPAPAQVEYSVKLVEEDHKQAERYLKAKRGELREKGIRARTRIVFGQVASTITRVAEAEGVDLIAMASHGRGGLARVFYGSVAAAVLQSVNRPLLLIRARDD